MNQLKSIKDIIDNNYKLSIKVEKDNIKFLLFDGNIIKDNFSNLQNKIIGYANIQKLFTFEKSRNAIMYKPINFRCYTMEYIVSKKGYGPLLYDVLLTYVGKKDYVQMYFLYPPLHVKSGKNIL